MIKTYPCLPVQVYIPSLWATDYEFVQKVRTQSGLEWLSIPFFRLPQPEALNRQSMGRLCAVWADMDMVNELEGET